MHIRSLCNALNRSCTRLQYVRDALSGTPEEFVQIQDEVADALSVSVIKLQGVMDGFIMLDQPDQTELTRAMSFQRTDLREQVLRDKQQELKSLQSSKWPGRGTYVDFWGIADFWKHYMPYQPPPSEFTQQNINDYELNLGGGSSSGPIFIDLVVPASYGAVEIARSFALQHRLDAIYWPQAM